MFLHNRKSINLTSFRSCSNVSYLLYLIILDFESRKNPAVSISFAGLENSETKLRKETKLSGDSIIQRDNLFQLPF